MKQFFNAISEGKSIEFEHGWQIANFLFHNAIDPRRFYDTLVGQIVDSVMAGDTETAHALVDMMFSCQKQYRRQVDFALAHNHEHPDAPMLGTPLED